MALSVEWRVRGGADVLLLVDVVGMCVTEAVTPDAGLLEDYLDVTGDLERWRRWTGWRAVGGEEAAPGGWGDLVLSRADDGAVAFADPELYWDGVRRWFLARGGRA